MPGKHYNKYSHGGPIVGPSHEEGGVLVSVKNGKHPLIEAEGGEFIVSKDAMEKHGDKIVALNEDGNDAPLLEGYYQSGGPLIENLPQDGFGPEIVDFPQESLSPDSRTWIRKAVENYLPSDDPRETEALINLGESVLPTRLPNMDDWNRIWNSDNPAQELMNFGVMLALTRGKGAGKKKVTPKKIQDDIKRQVKKADVQRKSGIVPITKGGREGRGLDDVHDHELQLFDEPKPKYDWSKFDRTGDMIYINDPSSMYNGWRGFELTNGRWKIFDKKGNEIKNKTKNKRDMDSHDYGDLRGMLEKDGILDENIDYILHTPEGPQIIPKAQWEHLRVQNIVDESNKAIFESGIKSIPYVKPKWKMLPVEKDANPVNGGRLWEVIVDDKPVVVQGIRYGGGDATKKPGWYIVSEEELANPSAPRLGGRNNPNYLGSTRDEAMITLRSGENPVQRNRRKNLQSRVTKKEKEGPTTDINIENPMKSEDRGDPQRYLKRLQREKKEEDKLKIAQRKKDAKYNQRYMEAKRKKEVPKGMSRKDWIENEKSVDEMVKAMENIQRGKKP